jgi:hypothetical protein
VNIPHRFNQGRRTTIEGLIIRVRDGEILAYIQDLQYAMGRLGNYGDPGTVELRPCTDAEARDIEAAGEQRRATYRPMSGLSGRRA